MSEKVAYERFARVFIEKGQAAYAISPGLREGD